MKIPRIKIRRIAVLPKIRSVESPFLPKIRFTENSFRRMTFYIEFTIRRIPFYTENGKNNKNASTLKIHIANNFKVKENIIKYYL